MTPGQIARCWATLEEKPPRHCKGNELLVCWATHAGRLSASLKIALEEFERLPEEVASWFEE